MSTFNQRMQKARIGAALPDDSVGRFQRTHPSDRPFLEPAPKHCLGDKAVAVVSAIALVVLAVVEIF